MKNYRADIDGLRAIAVILVVLYHLRTARCTGGFVGVDVFFVISGYLLSALIMADIEAGEFTIANFYEKRIRRIFPALIALLFGVAVMGCLFLFPTELSACGKSLLAALFSVSNFYFWKHSGYFAATTAVNPLLHTWSLAVEEQFYLVLPLLLKSLRSISRPRVITILCGIASLSLLVSSITAGCPTFRLLVRGSWGAPSRF